MLKGMKREVTAYIRRELPRTRVRQSGD